VYTRWVRKRGIESDRTRSGLPIRGVVTGSGAGVLANDAGCLGGEEVRRDALLEANFLGGALLAMPPLLEDAPPLPEDAPPLLEDVESSLARLSVFFIIAASTSFALAPGPGCMLVMSPNASFR